MPSVSKMLVLLAVVAAPTAFAGTLRDVDHFEKSSEPRGKCCDHKCPDDWGRVHDWDKKECRDRKCKDDECCEKKGSQRCRDHKPSKDCRRVHDWDRKECKDKCHDDDCCEKDKH